MKNTKPIELFKQSVEYFRNSNPVLIESIIIGFNTIVENELVNMNDIVTNLIKEHPDYYLHRQEVWDYRKCNNRTKPPYNGKLPYECGRIEESGVYNEKFYYGAITPFPKIPDDFEIYGNLNDGFFIKKKTPEIEETDINKIKLHIEQLYKDMKNTNSGNDILEMAQEVQNNLDLIKNLEKNGH